MRTIFALLLLLTAFTAFGNINYIQPDKIPGSDQYIDSFNFIKEHARYYNHWQPHWTYEVSKESLIKQLKKCYAIFSTLDRDNLENSLLLGDIAHYLYNLQEDKYDEYAVGHYNKAIYLAGDDYRSYWFIANHYALSNHQEKSIAYFLKSQRRLPDDEPAAFWEEFAFAAAIANMTSHCIKAMDKARSILGEPGYFEQQLGQRIYNRIRPVKSDSSYSYKDIWAASNGPLTSFVSRPLGLKFLVDSTWQVNFYDYQNNQAVVTMVPPTIPNKSGREITYTIALIIRVAKPGETLADFIDNLTAKYPDKKEFAFSNKYKALISYEIEDEKMYREIGGAHMHMIGLERERPDYAGLLLEQPVAIPAGGGENKLSFYSAGDSQGRFDGEIFYAIMLDSCEDIYHQSYKVFRELFEKQLIIE